MAKLHLWGGELEGKGLKVVLLCS